MKKLTIENLSPYFPYRLKFIDTDSGNIYEAMSMYDDSLGLYSETLPTEPFYLDGRTAYFKPILRTLSDLIQPVFEEVAPLTIISHEYFGFGKDYISYPEFQLINVNGFVGFQSHNQGVYFVREETNYGISTYFTLQLKSNGLWISQKVTQQLEMFQYLFKHHFDVFGLIDSGLAIDINSLNDLSK